MTEETTPKCIKAEMIPGPQLVCDFDNGEKRYFPVNDQMELLMNPADLALVKKTHGMNLFMGSLATWMGNDIAVEENGNVLLNKLVIPNENLWKYGKKHLTDANKELSEKLEEEAGDHPIEAGFKRLSALWWIIGIIVVLTIIAAIISR